jgi:sulfite reductase alpha subunit-like flavoprotein
MSIHVSDVPPVRQGVLDVSGASPRRRFFQVLAHFTPDASDDDGSPAAVVERERLLYFSGVEGRDDLYRYNQREARSVLEVLQDFRTCRPPMEWLLEASPIMKPRQYSIASSARCAEQMGQGSVIRIKRFSLGTDDFHLRVL